MKLKINFPIELGRKFRYMVVNNFKDVQYFYGQVLSIIKDHQTKDKHAHNAKQIDYKLSNVHDELQYQDGRIEGLVVGHNGDGIEELKDSRTALDGRGHELLSKRLKHDFETVKKNIEDKLNPEFEGRFKIMMVPNITNICYGRGVGYKIEEIVLSEEIQKISATKIRAKMREEGKLK